MRNAEIADALDELGTLYELDGAVRYRVIAYHEAARVIRESPVSVEELSAQGRATDLPGVGATLAEKIATLIETGEIPSATKLKAKVPASLIEVTRLPGVGAKTARRMYDELGIATLEQLEEAARSEKLRAVKGLGPKAEQNVIEALERLQVEGAPGRLLLSKVKGVADRLAADLREHPASDRVEVAGSVRRWSETCKDIDIIATASEPAELAQALRSHTLVAQASAGGDAGTRVVTHNGISVDLRIAPPECFGDLLQHLTGSATHSVQLRERAQKMGLSVSEYGIADVETGDVETFSTEEGVYERLGLDYIVPELREGRGEIAAAAERNLPALVALEDLRGDLHSHTMLSDGRNSLEEMAEAGKARGYAYLALTDHSASHGFDNHVTAEQLWERIEEIRAWNRGKRGFRLLAGSEVNILPDGSLDYDEDLLAALDWVIASVHTSFRISEKAMTERVLVAVENPLVDCIGHLTGRLITRREPYGIDVERIVVAAAEHGTMLEINGNPRRRDLSEHHARLAAEAGAWIVLTTDAHGVDTLSNIQYAVATARRGWLTAKQIANTRPWAQFKRLTKHGARNGG